MKINMKTRYKMKKPTMIFSIRIDPKLMREFKIYCVKNNLPITQVITQMIINLLRDKKRSE